MKQCFRLYTWQNPDWDITKEKRDPSKSPQKWGDEWDKLQPLYLKLKKKVGTLDFVWCYAEYEHWRRPEISRLWELDVPSSEIFHFLDSNIWAKMLQDIENNEQPEETSWDKLIVERSEGIKRLSAGNNDDITPLVLVPLCTSIQVIDKSRFNKGTGVRALKYEDLPTSVSDAERYRDEERKRGGFQ